MSLKKSVKLAEQKMERQRRHIQNVNELTRAAHDALTPEERMDDARREDFARRPSVQWMTRAWSKSGTRIAPGWVDRAAYPEIPDWNCEPRE